MDMEQEQQARPVDPLIAIRRASAEPERRSYVVEYWGCANPDHRHRTLKVAMECIAAACKARRAIKRWTDETRAKVLSQRRTGLTLRELGEEYGLSGNRIRQLVKRAERREREAMRLTYQQHGDWKRERGYP